MKNLFIFLLLLFCLFLPKIYAQESVFFAEITPTISMDFKDAELKDVLKVFSIQSGLNFIASEALQDRKITLYLDKVPLDMAMDKLFQANNLTYDLDKEANIFIVKDWGKPDIETITKVFFLKYATVSSSALSQEIEDEIGTNGGESESEDSEGEGSEDASGITGAVKKLLSDKGSVIEDSRTNSLIVTDTPKNMERVTQVIASLDVPAPQVLLEVEILDVNKNVVDAMGFEWNNPLASLTVSGSRETSFPFGGSGTSGFGRTLSATVGNWEIDDWNAAHYGPSIITILGQTIDLDFLRTHSDTKSLARPKILALNNETAEIKVTTQEAVSVSTIQSSAGSALTTQESNVPDRVETGISLRVTPQINTETDEITMFVVPLVKDTSTSALSTADNTIKDPEERSAKTIVRVKDSETVVIGGLIRTEKSETRKKLPILADIPILGALFRHKSKTKDQQRELLIFITPHIIKDKRIEVAQAKNIILEREQDVAVTRSRKNAIGAVLNQLEKNN